MNSINFYTKLINLQLLNVVRQAFQYIANKNQLHNHEIYLTFDSTMCDIAPKLQAMYQHQMSILIMHNYTALNVTEKHIEIALNLVTGHENLIIPFHAIIEFIDHTEKFSLKFTPDSSKTENIIPSNTITNTNTNPSTTTYASSKIIKLHQDV